MSTANKRKTLMMTDGEIRTSYRQAKNQKAQIKILAELNACSVAEICDILGVEPPKRTGGRKYLPHKWTDEDLRILYNMLRSGYSYTDIGRVIGVSKVAVINKTTQLWGGRPALRRESETEEDGSCAVIQKNEKEEKNGMNERNTRGGSRKKLDPGVIDDIKKFSADGLKNTEIAERLGISVSSVSRYLNGGRKMPELKDNDAIAGCDDRDEDFAYLLEDRDRIAAERDKLKIRCDALSDANAKLKDKNKILSVTVDAGREIELRQENERLRLERDELIRNIEAMQKDLVELGVKRTQIADLSLMYEAAKKACEKYERDIERYRSAGELIERLNARCRNYRLENIKLRRAVGCVLEECAYLIVPAAGQDGELPEIEEFYNIGGDLVFKAKKEDVPAATETSGGYAL